MTAGVLAVMDAISDAFPAYSANAKAVLDTRATVAELIEAAQAMSDWWSAHSSLGQVGALRRALARAGGDA